MIKRDGRSFPVRSIKWIAAVDWLIAEDILRSQTYVDCLLPYLLSVVPLACRRFCARGSASHVRW